MKWEILGISLMFALNIGALLVYWFASGTLVNWTVTGALIVDVLIAAISFLRIKENGGSHV